MPRILHPGLAAALTTMLLVTALHAQTAPQAAEKPPQRPPESIAELEDRSRQAYDKENWLGYYIANMKLHQQRPYEPQYLTHIVRACGRLDRKSTAYHYMLMMQKQGLAQDFNAFEDTVSIRNTEAYRYLNDLLILAGDPAGSAEVFAQLPVQAADIQAVARDAGGGRLLAGTASKGSVVSVGPDGSMDVVLKADSENGLWSVNGLAVDPDRERLWVSSAASPRYSGFVAQDENRGALFEFNLKSLELLKRYDLPADGLEHELGSLALTADGHVYVIDRATPAVYRKTPGGDRLEPFVTIPELEALRDIAVTPDNSRVFVADAFKGVLVVDPVAEQSSMLGGPDNISLGRVEGIEYRKGELYILQSGIEPDRLLRLKLDQTGSNVTEISPVASALPEFDGPGALTLDGGTFYFVANRGSGGADALLMQASVDAGRDYEPAELQKARQDILSSKQ